MGGGEGQVQETPAQKEMARIAMQKMQDYEQRWLPVQQNLAAKIQEMGAPDSAARKRAAGAAAADSRAQFGMAARKVEKAQTASGAGIGSGRFNLAQADLSTDQARSTGTNVAATDQYMDEQYLAGLTDLMKLGQGESRAATSNLTNVGILSARNAQVDAELAARERSERMGNIGSVAGMAYGLRDSGGQEPLPNHGGIGITEGNSPYSLTGEQVRARH